MGGDEEIAVGLEVVGLEYMLVHFLLCQPMVPIWENVEHIPDGEAGGVLDGLYFGGGIPYIQ